MQQSTFNGTIKSLKSRDFLDLIGEYQRIRLIWKIRSLEWKRSYWTNRGRLGASAWTSQPGWSREGEVLEKFLENIGQSTRIFQSSHSKEGYSWTDMANHNARIWKGLYLRDQQGARWAWKKLERPECLQGIVCYDHSICIALPEKLIGIKYHSKCNVSWGCDTLVRRDLE